MSRRRTPVRRKTRQSWAVEYKALPPSEQPPLPPGAKYPMADGSLNFLNHQFNDPEHAARHAAANMLKSGYVESVVVRPI